MRPRHKISRAGIDLIESFEGLRHRAARLADGRWTIGYGHTLSAREGAEVSQQDAEALLLFDLIPVVETVGAVVYTPLTQNQFDALTAFAFNVGIEAFRQSDVLKRINQGRLTEAACAFDLWRRAEVAGDPIVLDALIRRRAAEKALFLTPAEGFVPTPSSLIRPALDVAAPGEAPSSRPVEIETPLEGDTAQVRRMDGWTAPAPEAVAEAAHLVSISTVEDAEPPLPDTTNTAPSEAVVQAAADVEPPAPQPETAEPVAVTWSDVPPVETRHELEVQAAEASEPGAEAMAEAAPAAVEHALEPMAPTLAAVSYFTPIAEPEAEPEASLAAEPAPVVAPEPAALEVEPSEAEPHALDVEPFPAFEAEAAQPAPQAEPAPEPQPEPEPEPAKPAQVIAAASRPVRVYSNYGPMGVPALGVPPAVTPAQHTEAPLAETAAPFGPPAVADAETLAVISQPEAMTSHGAPPPEALVLTPPPEDWEPPAQPQWEPSFPTAEVHADQAPLFEEAYGGGDNGQRIVRHEELTEEPLPDRRLHNALYLLLGAVGVAAFAGAVAAFMRGQTNGSDIYTPYAWGLAVLGAGCVAGAVYFLLKELGGSDD